ncbi:UDP-glycosyltransferase 88F4-like [Vitis vinifera]|uniref:Glycosyltransferase n=1 Tax=Vitis vinifera TaxID=29760 RepID=F6I3W8_VITVI|nr:UDP-glycosyltransferase 88F4-like [Vitis vinifera]|eukprot:XP_002280543.1 PREDICTED: UDP-glycosyltransferase 88F4-like [Vitis vinifera]
MEDAIVLYPAPGIGHVVSMIELGKLILRRYSHRFSITILLAPDPFDTPATTSYIDHISQTNPSIFFHRFPYLSVHTSSSTRSHLAVLFEFIRLSASNVLHSLQQLSRASTIRAFIIDYFCASALPMGRGLGIPTYYFLTSGAASIAAIIYFPTIHKQTESSNKSFKDMPTTFIHFPGLPPLQATRMLQPLLNRDDPAYDDMLYFSELFPKSDGLMINTFDDLEPIALKTIREGTCVPNGPTPSVYCIGPLIADTGEDESNSSGNKTRHGCLSWLDTQPSQSVVFLCLGSKGTFSPAQMKEIANGLERSDKRFLWVVKNPPSTDKSKRIAVTADVDLNVLMPEGFLERTKDRGMVVKSWAPQVAVLNHPLVGGFVTHCGWNSVLEAVVAGVPMVAWPLYAEQHLNKAALVEVMKMAIGVEQMDEDMFVSGAEVERRVRELMEYEEGRELRERSRKMREMALAAWKEGGSSTTALAKLADVWSQD